MQKRTTLKLHVQLGVALTSFIDAALINSTVFDGDNASGDVEKLWGAVSNFTEPPNTLFNLMNRVGGFDLCKY